MPLMQGEDLVYLNAKDRVRNDVGDVGRKAGVEDECDFSSPAH